MQDLELMLRLATTIHNATPHPSVGTSPYEYIHGFDMILPQTQRTSKLHTPEVARRITVIENAMLKIFAHQLYIMSKSHSSTTDENFKVGDIVSFPLTPAEQDRFRHLSGMKSWNPTHSYPYRIIVIHDKQATVKPLWTTSKDRSVPISQLHKLPSDCPRELKDLVPKVLNCPTPNILREGGFSPLAPTPITEVPESPSDRPQKRARLSSVPTATPNYEVAIKDDLADPKGI